MFHLAALHESVDQAIAPITWVSDALLSRVDSNDSIIVTSELQRIGAVRLGSASIERARIVNPDLDAKTNMPYELAPLGAEEPETPLVIQDWFDQPLGIPSAQSRLTIEVENDAAGGAEDVYGMVWFVRGNAQRVSGDIRTIRAVTTASAMTANVWNERALTFDQNLTGKNYQVVGGRLVSATDPIMWRMSFPGQVMRPGAPAYDAVGDLDYHRFRRGGLGVWGTFSPNVPPVVEVLPGSAINEAQIIELDVLVGG